MKKPERVEEFRVTGGPSSWGFTFTADPRVAKESEEFGTVKPLGDYPNSYTLLVDNRYRVPEVLEYLRWYAERKEELLPPFRIVEVNEPMGRINFYSKDGDVYRFIEFGQIFPTETPGVFRLYPDEKGSFSAIVKYMESIERFRKPGRVFCPKCSTEIL